MENRKMRAIDFFLLIIMLGLVAALTIFLVRESPRLEQVIPSGQGDVRVIDAIFDTRVTVLLIETRNPTWQIIAVIDARGNIGFEKVR